MVSAKSLKNDPEKREIKTIIKSPTGDITVYEPTKEQIEEIMKLEEFIVSLNKEDNKKDESTLEISDKTIMHKIVPLLTDIDMTDVTEKDIEEIMEHPSLAWMEVALVIAGIVTRIYKMVILSYANAIQSNELSLETMKLNHEAIGSFINRATETDKGKELLSDLMEESDRVAQIEKQQLQDAIKKLDINNDSEKSKHTDGLSSEVDSIKVVDSQDNGIIQPKTPQELYKEKVLDVYGDSLD